MNILTIKISIAPLFFLLFFNISYGQLEKSAFIGGGKFTIIEQQLISNKNEVYVLGKFAGDNASFGNQVLYNHSKGSVTCFIAKFNTSGDVKWAYDLGGLENIGLLKMQAWKNNTILIAGVANGELSYNNKRLAYQKDSSVYQDINSYFLVIDEQGSLIKHQTFNDLTFNNFVISPSYEVCVSYGSGFKLPHIKYSETNDTLKIADRGIIRFDNQLRVVWSKYMDLGQESKSWEMDNEGNLYGIYPKVIDPYRPDTLFGNSYGNILYKMNPQGVFIWFKATNDYSVSLMSFKVSKQTINVLGRYSRANMHFDGKLLFDFNNKFPNGTYTSLLSLQTSNGNLKWAKNIQNDLSSYPTAVIETDTSGNVYVAGCKNDDSLVVEKETHIAKGNFFLIKYSEKGNQDFIKLSHYHKGNTNYAQNHISDLKWDKFSKKLYIIGCFKSDSIIFDQISIANCNEDLLGLGVFEDGFLFAFSDNGKPLWAKGLHGAGREIFEFISLTDKSQIFVSGTCRDGKPSFDPFSLIYDNDTTPYYKNFYFLNYTDQIITAQDKENSILKLIVYPNPILGVLHYSFLGLKENHQWKIINSIGLEISHGLSNNRSDLPSEGLISGHYLLILNDGYNISSTGFVVQ
ncbi:MAG: T9SS type A sorting domain-containing protein [Opitutaceae bacterium]|nr:T9SS type A sorting domain-containing protein [Cytophagales bacterium]